MLKNIREANSKKENFEILFLFLISFFSIISFWVTVPVSVYVIIICKEKIKKIKRTNFYKTIIILSPLCILLSIFLQVAVIIETGQLLGGIRCAPDYFQAIGDKLSIVGY